MLRNLAILSFLIAHTATASESLVTVKGEAESESVPDFILVSATIYALEKTVDRAKTDVDARARDTFSALEDFAIDDKDLSFGGVSITRDYTYDRNDNEN